MNESVKDKISSIFGDIKIDSSKSDITALSCPPDTVLSVLSFLKNRGYGHLGLISCADWPRENKLELVYVISSYMLDDEEHSGETERENILVKTRINRDDPVFLSSIPVFKNAEPYEREIHELFGIDFEGHPRLRPLFLEREYDIPPFRKDFDTREYVKDVFDSVPFVEKKADAK